MTPISPGAAPLALLERPDHSLRLGAVGRLGRWTAGNFRVVAAAWLVIAIAPGGLAPRAAHALSGAGWESSGSESVQARGLIDRSFRGSGTYSQVVVVHSPGKTVSDRSFQRVLRRVEDTLRRNPALTAMAPTVIA